MSTPYAPGPPEPAHYNEPGHAASTAPRPSPPLAAKPGAQWSAGTPCRGLPVAVGARLSVDARRDGDGTLVLAADGEIDLSTEPLLRQALLTALAQESARTVLVDMSTVTFLDAAGIGALVSAHHAAAAHQRALRLANACPLVTRVLEITGLLETFGLTPNSPRARTLRRVQPVT